MAFVVTIALISTTAGLGVLALIEVPLAAAVIVSILTERTTRRRRAREHR